ncbi:MAG TPA: PQQ-binding-like beta-propeller repeat protein, partial [Thermoanaerobaculia bacterium]
VGPGCQGCRPREAGCRQSEAGAVPLTDRHSLASHANSTPATDGARLVVVFPTIGMRCYSVSGELLWSKELGPLNAGNYFDASSHWGFASSPILHEGTVILQADVHEGAFVAAYELATGRELWKTAREEISTWATPLVVRGPAGDELVTNGTTIRGYDPRTGRELWRLRPNSEQVVPTPVAAGGLVYVTTGYPPAFPIYALRPGQRGDLSSAVGVPGNDAFAWSRERGGAYMSTPIVYRGLLYIPNGGGRLTTYDASTGEPVYRARFSRGGGFTGSPVAADGRLYFPNQELGDRVASRDSRQAAAGFYALHR